MKKIAYLDNKSFGYVIVPLLYTIYIAIFKTDYAEAEIAVAALATIPVIGAGWYFSSFGGVLMAILLVLSNIAILMTDGFPTAFLFNIPDMLIGAVALVFIGWIVGSLGSTI